MALPWVGTSSTNAVIAKFLTTIFSSESQLHHTCHVSRGMEKKKITGRRSFRGGHVKNGEEFFLVPN